MKSSMSLQPRRSLVTSSSVTSSGSFVCTLWPPHSAAGKQRPGWLAHAHLIKQEPSALINEVRELGSLAAGDILVSMVVGVGSVQQPFRPCPSPDTSHCIAPPAQFGTARPRCDVPAPAASPKPALGAESYPGTSCRLPGNAEVSQVGWWRSGLQDCAHHSDQLPATWTGQQSDLAGTGTQELRVVIGT